MERKQSGLLVFPDSDRQTADYYARQFVIDGTPYPGDTWGPIVFPAYQVGQGQFKGEFVYDITMEDGCFYLPTTSNLFVSWKRAAELGVPLTMDRVKDYNSNTKAAAKILEFATRSV